MAALLSFVIFLILLIVVGVIAARFSRGTEEDYWLADRSFGKYFIGFSAHYVSHDQLVCRRPGAGGREDRE